MPIEMSLDIVRLTLMHAPRFDDLGYMDKCCISVGAAAPVENLESG
jgi:hypothetical protein